MFDIDPKLGAEILLWTCACAVTVLIAMAVILFGW